MSNLSPLHPHHAKQETSQTSKIATYRHPYRSIKQLKELYANSRDVFLKAQTREGLLEILVTKAYDQICVEKAGWIWGNSKYYLGYGIGYAEMVDKYQRRVVKSILEEFDYGPDDEALTDFVCRIRDTTFEKIELILFPSSRVEQGGVL